MKEGKTTKSHNSYGFRTFTFNFEITNITWSTSFGLASIHNSHTSSFTLAFVLIIST
jgi:hypothetical protein